MRLRWSMAPAVPPAPACAQPVRNPRPRSACAARDGAGGLAVVGRVVLDRRGGHTARWASESTSPICPRSCGQLPRRSADLGAQDRHRPGPRAALRGRGGGRRLGPARRADVQGGARCSHRGLPTVARPAAGPRGDRVQRRPIGVGAGVPQPGRVPPGRCRRRTCRSGWATTCEIIGRADFLWRPYRTIGSSAARGIQVPDPGPGPRPAGTRRPAARRGLRGRALHLGADHPGTGAGRGLDPGGVQPGGAFGPSRPSRGPMTASASASVARAFR